MMRIAIAALILLFAQTTQISTQTPIPVSPFVEQYLDLTPAQRSLVIERLDAEAKMIRARLDHLGIALGEPTRRRATACQDAPQAATDVRSILSRDPLDLINSVLKDHEGTLFPDAPEDDATRSAVFGGPGGLVLRDDDIRTRRELLKPISDHGDLLLNARRAIANLITRCHAGAIR